MVTAVLLLLCLRSADAPKKVLIRSAQAIGFVLIMLAIGEVFLWLVYSDGMSFSSHTGPIVKEFERHFRFNRYDGPSRGPEIWGPRKPSQVRILFQGGSITWGQGVKDEDLLYTNRLLARLRSEDLDIEAAVLAEPGRELDGHLAASQVGSENFLISLYTSGTSTIWSLIKRRPRPIWHGLFFHNLMLRISYLWFLLDYRLSLLASSPAQSYRGYVYENFGARTEGSTVFAELFRIWAAEAEQLTPSVMVMLYPGAEPREVFADFRSRMVDLCQEEGIATVDLSPWIRERFGHDYTQMYATQFDGHPNASVHDLMADVLYSQIKILWPELFAH